MLRHVLLIALALLLWGGDADKAAAQSNPFTGRPAPTAAPPPPAEEGVLASVARFAARLQRDMTQGMTGHMKAVRDDGSPTALLLGIALAFAYGVVHAVGPGHGKFVVVSYFLSQEARIWRGMAMGLQIAVFHVISAIIAVALADVVLRQVFGGAPEELRWVALASYASIAVIGVALAVRALRRGAGHGHDHHHDHDHAGGHSHSLRLSGQGLLSLGVGLVPCTGAVLVMIFALANGILLAGLVLAGAIAIGMAVTMAGLGVLSIVARQAMIARFAGDDRRHARLGRAFELVGAAAITAIGALLFLGALDAPPQLG